MNERKEFNLLDEPWIKVMRPDASVIKVSLKEALLKAHEYVGLAGELPTQDFALLRLMLAVLHAVFHNVNIAGEVSPLETGEEAMERWQELWNLKELPAKPINDYLEKWRERFWLIHPERPFYQVPELHENTSFLAEKLNSEISKSGNKVRLFPLRRDAAAESLKYDEAARWLVHLQGFDDASGKPKKEGNEKLLSSGVGWLGKISPIAAVGDNLFESLVLNLVLTNENEEPWESASPSWEEKQASVEQRKKIPIPLDQAAIFTLQSRRVILTVENGSVKGYKLIAGEFFDIENAFAEQMTLWRTIRDKRTNALKGYIPRTHDYSRSFWRDFSVIAVKNEKQAESDRLPGIVQWHMLLYNNKIWKANTSIRYQIVSIQYDANNCSIVQVFTDSMTFSSSILSDMNRPWQHLVESAVGMCDKAAQTVGRLAADINKASGGKGKDASEKAKEQFYYRVDTPFRLWLECLSPETGNLIDTERKWLETVRSLAKELGEELVKNASAQAFVGHKITVDKDKKVEKYYTVSEAYNRFIYELNKLK